MPVASQNSAYIAVVRTASDSGMYGQSPVTFVTSSAHASSRATFSAAALAIIARDSLRHSVAANDSERSEALLVPARGIIAYDYVMSLQRHPFFDGMDWEHLYSTQPPFRPSVAHELDTQVCAPCMSYAALLVFQPTTCCAAGCVKVLQVAASKPNTMMM